MEKAMEKAIKGGYAGYNVSQGAFTETEAIILSKKFCKYKEVHLLSPFFWQAIGRGMGNKEIMRCDHYNPKYNEPGERGCFSDLCEYAGYKDPKQMFIRFAEYIWDNANKDINSFFEELLK